MNETDKEPFKMTPKWLAVAAMLATSPASAQGYPLEPPIAPAPTLCYTNGAILGVLANGTLVQVLNVDASNGSPWAYVAVANGSVGWVFLPYLYCGR
jgi:hypothetical protein